MAGIVGRQRPIGPVIEQRAEVAQRVAEELDTPVTGPTESMTAAQLRRTSPELLPWYERLPRFP